VIRFDGSYEIHEVAELTGLAPARLRAWERRYEVVRPERMPNGYRVYTAGQVALLRAFARLVEAGERIGDLAGRPASEVLAQADVRMQARALDGSPHGALIEAVRGLDREQLETLVAQQLSLRGLGEFARDVVLPLARELGELWVGSQIPVAAEHLASEVVLHALKGGLRMARGSGPLMVCGCLPGERHEWGLLATLATLQDEGWRVHYLGPDLPVPDLVGAAWKLSPAVAALSGSDPATVQASLPALSAFPGKLPPNTVAAIGGSGVEPHAKLLRRHGFRIEREAFARGALTEAARRG
jgi:DNA-binding transcriptional MerR regulator